VAIPRVLPDTNVCYPISLLDLILRCDEASLISVLWTDDLLDELARVWVRKGVRTKAAAARICAQIRVAFAGQDIPRADYEDLIADMPGADPDDHLHAAAAVSRAPVTLVTNNVRDFPAKPLAELGVTVITPDRFFSALVATHRSRLVEIVSAMSASRRHPPMTVSDVLDALESAGVPGFVAHVRAVVG
jgi:predicted nucleic acid-binding protein